MVIFQAIIVAIVALFAFIKFSYNTNIAFSILIGGGASIVPNAVFASLLFRKMCETAPKQFVRRYLRSEVIKLILMGLLFVAGLQFNFIVGLAMVLGFILGQLGVLVYPLAYYYIK
ncbi:MAG: ATP synthase subunit I [Gammaproteobacteria bacterium]